MTTISFSIPDWMIIVLTTLGFFHIGVDIWKTISGRRLEKLKQEAERLKE